MQRICFFPLLKVQVQGNTYLFFIIAQTCTTRPSRWTILVRSKTTERGRKRLKQKIKTWLKSLNTFLSWNPYPKSSCHCFNYRYGLTKYWRTLVHFLNNSLWFSIFCFVVSEIFKYLLHYSHEKGKASKFMLIFLKATSAITKKSPQAHITYINRFSKVPWNFVKKTNKTVNNNRFLKRYSI